MMVRGLNSSSEPDLEWLGEFAKGERIEEAFKFVPDPLQSVFSQKSMTRCSRDCFCPWGRHSCGTIRRFPEAIPLPPFLQVQGIRERDSAQYFGSGKCGVEKIGCRSFKR